MSNWPLVRLGDHLRVKHGFAFQGEHFSDRGVYIVLTPGNFIETGGFKPKSGTEKYFAATPPEEFVLRRGDIVIAMTEQAQGLLGSSAMIPTDGIYLHNQRIGLVQPVSDEVDRTFLYYLFNTRVVRDQIQATATGSKVRHTAPARVESVTVPLPPLPIQRKISAILCAYDDLIENNSRRIKTLEEIAQRIYHEWFVDFRYPGHEDVPLVASELGPIPDGWEVGPIGGIVEVLGGGTPSKGVAEYWEPGAVTWFTPTDLTRASAMFMSESRLKISELGLLKSSAKLFPRGAVMMTSRATIGVVSVTTVSAATNQGFITCVPSDLVGTYHLYFWLIGKRDFVTALASGATFKEINKATFRSIPFLRAAGQVERDFEELIDPIAREIQTLLRAQRTLRGNRLLPRLISGEIDVTDCDIDVSDLAA